MSERCVCSNQRVASPIRCVCRKVPGLHTTAVSGGPRASVVQSAHLWDGDHPSFGWVLDSTWHRCVASGGGRLGIRKFRLSHQSVRLVLAPITRMIGTSTRRILPLGARVRSPGVAPRKAGNSLGRQLAAITRSTLRSTSTAEAAGASPIVGGRRADGEEPGFRRRAQHAGEGTRGA